MSKEEKGRLRNERRKGDGGKGEDTGLKGRKGGGEGKERWKQEAEEVQGCEEGRTGEGGEGEVAREKGKGTKGRVRGGRRPAGPRASHPSHVLPRGVTLPLSCHVSLDLTAASGGTPRPIIAHSRPIYFHTTAPSRALRSPFVCDDKAPRGKRGSGAHGTRVPFEASGGNFQGITIFIMRRNAATEMRPAREATSCWRFSSALLLLSPARRFPIASLPRLRKR